MNPCLDPTTAGELQCRHHGRRDLTFNGTSMLSSLHSCTLGQKAPGRSLASLEVPDALPSLDKVLFSNH